MKNKKIFIFWGRFDPQAFLGVFLYIKQVKNSKKKSNIHKGNLIAFTNHLYALTILYAKCKRRKNV